MGTNIDVDFTDIYSSLNGANSSKARYAMGNQMIQDMNRYVPKESGDLRQQVMLTGDNDTIVYNSVYARRHFYAPGGWNYTTPGTGPRWDEKGRANHIEDWKNVYVKGAGL